MRKNKFTAIAVSGVLLGTLALTVYAVSPVIKEMNLFQRAFMSGENVSEVDEAGDFNYTSFENAAKNDVVSNNVALSDEKITADEEITMESFIDNRVNIYNKMLNTIDYIDKVSMTAKTNMLGVEESLLRFNVDIDSGISYQSVTEGNAIVSETYSNIDSGMVAVNNTEKSYTENNLPVYTREDTPYIPLKSRIVTEDDGIPSYYYRRNVTNCPLASYCLVPQEITFSYLKDFDLWTIGKSSEEYLGRDCVVIVGKPSAYIATKHGIDAFGMIVDKETGVLLKFEGTYQGDIVRYMEVTEVDFAMKKAVKQFSVSEYVNYEVVKRY